MTYTTEDMREIWTDQYALDLWAAIEVAVLRAQAEIGHVPAAWWEQTSRAPVPTVAEWRHETEMIGHEVVAFLGLWCENGAEHVHIGMTSSDLTDTTLGVRVLETSQLMQQSIERCQFAVDRLAVEYSDVPRLGRTHGQPAVAMTYGDLFDRWHALLVSARQRLSHASRRAGIGKISGPIGTHMHIDEYVERTVCAEFGLAPAAGSSQIVQRDNLAAWVAELGVLASVVEAIALELRLLSHSAIGEARDSNGSTSSAMPHKTNPNRLERLTGLARIVRATYEPIAAGISQWHERDMAHSSVERTLLPQATSTTHYMLEQLATILDEIDMQPLRAIDNIHQHEADTWTHSIQTHLQLRGHTYLEARSIVRQLIRDNLSLGSLRLAIAHHPDLTDFSPTNPIREGALDGVL